LNIEPLLREAKRQLHAEADYLREADHLCRYGALLADADEFLLPEVHRELTTGSILAMSRVDGVGIESLGDAPQAERDRVVRLLLALLLRELFEFRLVQTDPNFANYRYDRAAGRLILLDLGATRPYPEVTVEAYRRLMTAAIAGDRQAMSAAAMAIGYFQAGIPDHQRGRPQALRACLRTAASCRRIRLRPV